MKFNFIREKAEKKKLYFQKDDHKYVKFLDFVWKQPDMYKIVLSGLSSQFPKILKQWKDIDLSEEDIKSDRYNWKDLTEPETPEEIESISFHSKEKCFRFKLRNKQEFKEVKENEIKRYIDIIIMSDMPDVYNFEKKLKGDYEVFQKNKNNAWILRGAFAIDGTDLRNHPFLGKKLQALNLE